ncbi:MAG: sensor histidine kinase [Lachnospiraceae bacterium]
MKEKKHRSLQNIILLIIILFTLIIGTIIASLSAYFYNYHTKNAVLLSTDANLSFLVDSINQNIQGIERMEAFCITHNYIGDFMNYSGNSNPSTAIKAYDRLYDEYTLSTVNPYIHRIIVGNNNGKYLMICDPSYSTSSNVDQITLELPQYKEQINSKETDFTYGFTKDPYSKRYGKEILILIQPITYNYSFVRGGYVSLSVYETLFTSPLKYYAIPTGSDVYLTLGQHSYAMTNEGLTEFEPENIRVKETKGLSSDSYATFYSNASGNNKIAITKSLKSSDCFITQTISEDAFYAGKIFHVGNFALCFVLIIITSAILFFLFNRLLNKPIISIQKRLKEIAEGDFSRDDSIEWNHELGDIGRGINDLTEDLKELLESKIQDEKDKKDLEYKMLQSQINPHFLYNTLNSIKWMAVTQGAQGIADMTTALSRLLRTISKGTKLVISLREELSLVKDYFTIQQYRYGSALSMDVIVDDEVLYDAQIVQFTMQPIVENAIFHGIEPKQTVGKITIHAYFEDSDTAAISIEDNGIGMSDEQIAALFDEKENDPGQLFKEIGISNIQKRLQYEFGSDYGIRVESQLGEYTRMTIRIPMRRINHV